MNVRPVPRVTGALLSEPTPYVDDRGFFCRTSPRDRAAPPLAIAEKSLLP